MFFPAELKKPLGRTLAFLAALCLLLAGCSRKGGGAENASPAQEDEAGSEALKKALAERVVSVRSGFVAGEGALLFSYFFYSPSSSNTKQFSFDQEPYATYEDLLTSLLKNQIQAAVFEIHDAAKIWSLRRDSVVMAGVLKWGDWIVASGGFKASSFSSLSGKTIYISPKNSLADRLFCYEAGEHGIMAVDMADGIAAASENDCVYVDYRNPSARIVSILSGFSQAQNEAGNGGGSYVCAVLGEPYSSIALLNNPAVDGSFSLCDEYSLAHGGKSFPHLCVLVNRSFAENNGAAVLALQERLSSAISWLNSRPETAARTAVKYHLMVSRDSALSAARNGRYIWKDAQSARDEIDEAFSAVALENPGDSFYFSFSR